MSSSVELLVAYRAIQKGYVPCKPMVDGQRFDLVLVGHGRVVRLQVKSTNRKPTKSAGAICVNFRSGHRADGTMINQCYTADEIDAIVVYVPETGKFYWLGPELFSGRTSLQLRTEPAKNKQTKGVIDANLLEW